MEEDGRRVAEAAASKISEISKADYELDKLLEEIIAEINGDRAIVLETKNSALGAINDAVNAVNSTSETVQEQILLRPAELDGDITAARTDIQNRPNELDGDVQASKQTMAAKTDEVVAVGDQQVSEINKELPKVQSVANTEITAIKAIKPTVEAEVTGLKAQYEELRDTMKLSEAWSNTEDKSDLARVYPLKNYVLDSYSKHFPFNATWTSRAFELDPALGGYSGQIIVTTAVNVPADITSPLKVWLQLQTGTQTLNILDRIIPVEEAGKKVILSGSYTANLSQSTAPFLSARTEGYSGKGLPLLETSIVKGNYRSSMYVSNPMDNDGRSFPKYHGIAAIGADDPKLYVWQQSDEYIDYRFANNAMLSALAEQARL